MMILVRWFARLPAFSSSSSTCFSFFFTFPLSYILTRCLYILSCLCFLSSSLPSLFTPHRALFLPHPILLSDIHSRLRTFEKTLLLLFHLIQHYISSKLLLFLFPPNIIIKNSKPKYTK